MSDTGLEIVDVSVGDLKPYKQNARKNDKTVPELVKDINRFGFRIPIIAKKDGTLITGHTRLKAAKKMKLKTVPVLYWDDELGDEFRILDNKLSELATWDTSRLDAEVPGVKFANEIRKQFAKVGITVSLPETPQQHKPVTKGQVENTAEKHAEHFQKLQANKAAKVKMVECKHCHRKFGYK